MQAQSTRNKEAGQITFFFGGLSATLVLIMVFSISLGMLVHAKINLQNAADLAAFAGASVQARQLNTISFLNYEMRRHYKKYLFRTVVLGNMAQDSFPKAGGGSGPMEYIPQTNASVLVNYDYPTTCVVYNVSDNFCHLNKLPEISQIKADSLDTVGQAAAGQLEQLEHFRQNNCLLIGKTNNLLASYWLYNADHDLSGVGTTISADPDVLASLKIIKVMAGGLGLIPKMLLLNRRILTLQEFYLNAAPERLNYDQASRLRGAGESAAIHERALAAYFSAYHTLGDHTFDDPAQIVLEELLPSSNGQGEAGVLTLIPNKISFTSYAVDAEVDQTLMQNSVGHAAPCVPKLVPYPVDKLIVGYYKDIASTVYYGVKLKAKAKILFWPFSDEAEFTVYSFARPFGSRIGPQQSEWSSASREMLGTISGNNKPWSETNKFPNLQVKEDDPNAEKGMGFDAQEMVSILYTTLLSGQINSPAQYVQDKNISDAIGLAMHPNPFEAGRYNILSAMPDPFFMPFGGPLPSTGTDNPNPTRDLASFWAPLSAPGQTGEIQTKIAADLNSMLDSATQSGNKDLQAFQSKMVTVLSDSMDNYITALSSGQGEDDEGFNIVKLQNPFSNLVEQGSTFPNDLFLKQDELKTYKTSWNTQRDPTLTKMYRTGYSVKFIPFSSLKPLPFLPAGDDDNNLKGLQH